MLQTKALFFIRSDKPKDPFEGSFPENNAKYRVLINNNISYEKIKHWSDIYKQQRQYYYLNCWHLSEYESAAMWSIYLKNNEGIAIQTTFKKLEKIFENRAAND